MKLMMKKITILLFTFFVFHNYAQECVERVESGNFVSTAFLTNGEKYSWGNNEYGELGNGSTTAQEDPALTVMSDEWQDVSHGRMHTLALKNDGTIWGWGNNELAQLGDDTFENRTSPVQVGSDADWVAVSAGRFHSIGLKSDGTIWGWGSNQALELENTSVDYHTTPIQLSDDTDWDKIFAGSFRTFFIKTNGTLWVRGRNVNGGLGIGNASTAQSITQVGTDNNWKKVSLLFNSHTLAIKTDNTLWKWGEDMPGSSNTTNTNTPEQVGEDQWKDVVAGYSYSSGVKMDGTLWYWGGNYVCAEGPPPGLTLGSETPVQVGEENDWENISGAMYDAYVTKENNTLYYLDPYSCELITELQTSLFMNCQGLDNTTFDTNEITFYPNPVKDVLQWTKNENFSAFEVRNISGKVVKSGKIEASQINISELRSGVYFIFIENNEGRFIKHKILKE